MRSTLEKIGTGLGARYDTLERNISCASNSFYDSYLDLLESFLRCVAEEFSAEGDKKRSCGDLLRCREIREAFVGEMGLDATVYSKLGDYALKVNAHKHKKEKTVCVEVVVSYLSVFYQAVGAFCQYKKIDAPVFEIGHFEELFNSMERENQRLKEKIKSYGELIDDSELTAEQRLEYAALISQEESDGYSTEEENSRLHRRLRQLESLKDSLNKRLDGVDLRLRRVESEQREFAVAQKAKQSYTYGAKKYFCYNGTKQEQESERARLGGLGVALLVCICVDIVFSLIIEPISFLPAALEAIWAILALRVLLHAKCMERRQDAIEYEKGAIDEMYTDKGGLPRKTGRMQGKYILWLFLGGAGAFLKAFLAGSLAGAVVVTACVVSLVSISFYLCARSFYAKYESLHIEGADRYGKAFAFVYLTGDNRCYTVEEYKALLKPDFEEETEEY